MHTHTGVRREHIRQFLAQTHPRSVSSAHPRPRPPLPAQVPRIASVCKVAVSLCLCTLTCTLFSFTLCVCSLCFHVLERRAWRGGILSLFACTEMHARIHARMLAPVPCLGFSDYVAVSWYSLQRERLVCVYVSCLCDILCHSFLVLNSAQTHCTTQTGFYQPVGTTECRAECA